MLPMQERRLALSNLDLLLPPVDVGVFFCYRKPTKAAGDNLFSTFTSMVSVLKKAMAQALVSYYAFSGEVVQNNVGEPELLCNNSGVDFLEAFADVELQGLNLYNPDESIQGKLVPKKKQGVLSVQVTELKCGGLVVGCTFDHRVADAYSFNMFLVSWVEMAQSKALSLLPSFERSLLNPRRPGYYDPSLNDMYVPISTLPPLKYSQPTTSENQLVSRIYYIETDKVSLLQTLASGNGCKTTKLEAFIAFLWKMVATTEHSSDMMCRMGIVVDGRKRLREGDDEKVSMMASYFGNVLSIPFSKRKINELKESPLSWVANVIHECLETAATREHFLGLIDWVEAHRPEAAVAKIYSGSRSNDDGPTLVVSSGQGFPESKVDYGWGKPIFGSYHFPWGGKAGYVMPMPSPIGNGDWVVYMHMLKGQLELIEIKAAHFLRPLTWDYLNY
ncbi:hypothetical protein F0562_017681 [Nyssa sinensis]|uniref:Uncharacterized protein n=1 Tax=Nyssa sinensis TaxID=561372 RepID=A0A5J4ZIP8_9ASTE|nr:hypothetical protein F0562_017681 [Nyssa sinensis]